MGEETKNGALELTDDDFGNVAGGMAPEGYTPCDVFYSYDYGGSFCSTVCQYHSTKSCMMGYCKDSVCDEVKSMYHKWIGK